MTFYFSLGLNLGHKYELCRCVFCVANSDSFLAHAYLVSQCVNTARGFFISCSAQLLPWERVFQFQVVAAGGCVVPVLTAGSISFACCFGVVQERAANPPALGESCCNSSFRYSISIINYLNIGRLTGCFGPKLQKLNFQKLLHSATPYSVSWVMFSEWSKLFPS